MSTIYTLPIAPMTKESFAPFGELWNPDERPSERRIISRTDYEHDGQTTVGVIWQPYETLSFNELERHFGVSQSFVQLSGPPSIVCAAPATDPDDPFDVPNPSDVRAFLIDPNSGWCFKRGVWHSLNRHVLAPPGATYIIINSKPNPTQVVNYETSTGYLSRDLGGDKTPRTLDYKGRFGGVFQISL